MATALLTRTAPADWAGPLNPGSGCLGCLPVGLRGKNVWFARRNALAGPSNCTDPEPSYVQVSSTASGSLSEFDPAGGCDRSAARSAFVNVVDGVETSGGTAVITFGNSACGPGSTTSETYANLITALRSDGDDWSAWSGPIPGVQTRTLSRTYSYGSGEYGSGSATETSTTALDEDTQVQATAEVEAAEDRTDVWGGDADAQFPWLLAPGLPIGNHYGLGYGTMDPGRQEYAAPASPLLSNKFNGREVLRGRIAVPDVSFPGQTWRADWAVVTRRLGWNVARGGSGPGRTETTRERSYTLAEPMDAPDDALGPMAWAHASWGLLGYALQSVPPTPPAPAPGAPANPPTAGLRVASQLRRSRLRFAVRVPGVVTFRLRKLTVLDSDPTSYTTALANVDTAGTLAADGTNSTAAVDYAPPDQLRSVYLFVDEVVNALGHTLPASAWIAPGKVRDGWLGFIQLDHSSIQAGSVSYRRLEFTQETTVTSIYTPDPENPPTEDEATCSESEGFPWMNFTQTQTWTKTAGPGASQRASLLATPASGTRDWELTAASGSCVDQTWTGEVSEFDPPVASGIGGAWTVGAATATISETQPVDAEEQNGALWVNCARVEPATNPRFGGVTTAVATAGENTSAATYGTGEPLAVQQTGVIYLSAEDAGRSVQIVNLHVRGA